jgi:serine/threonine-protein kinase RsbW
LLVRARDSGYPLRSPMPSSSLRHADFDPARLVKTLDIEVPGAVEAITPAVGRVLEIAGTLSCAAGKEFEIETAVREALANAIRHGCRNDPGKSVQLCVACDASRGMLIVVRDPGRGFDPATLPSPTLGRNVFFNHGRGIYLINELMDEVSFHEGGTEIRMVKR